MLIFHNVLWIDPLISLFIALYVIYESFRILRESVSILMEAAPAIDLDKIKEEIEKIPGVKNAHHFYAWQMRDRDILFEAHVEVEDMLLSEAQKFIDIIREKLTDFWNHTHNHSA